MLRSRDKLPRAQHSCHAFLSWDGAGDYFVRNMPYFMTISGRTAFAMGNDFFGHKVAKRRHTF